MKQNYEEAQMEVVVFAALDVITTSSDSPLPPPPPLEPTTSEWTPASNMGTPDYGAWDD